MAKRSVGIAGSAVALGTLGIYLTYIGVKDVPFFDGMRALFRQEKPVGKYHGAYVPKERSLIGSGLPKSGNVTGELGLVGNAAAALPILRSLGNWTMYGKAFRPSGTSDHPKGLAIDIMRPTEAEAQRIISVFRSLPGAKYWIWNRQIANVAVDNWRIRSYVGFSPHTDHVHLSFS